MAYEQALLDVTAKAGSAVGKYYFCELSSSVEGQVDECNAATDKAYGVTQNLASASGESIDVRVSGITKVVAGAAIALNDYVGPDASGKAVTKSVPGQRARGIALESAGADGDIITILLLDVLVPGTHGIVAAGTFTTAGGDATESITAAGVVTSDIAIVTVLTAGATPRSIVAADAGSGAISVTLSGDPSTDHVLQYLVIRAVA